MVKKINFKSKRFILRYVNSIPNDQITAFFRMVYNGQCYAGNEKRKTSTRVSVIIPKEIANNNLKFMNEWRFYIVGIKETTK